MESAAEALEAGMGAAFFIIAVMLFMYLADSYERTVETVFMNQVQEHSVQEMK